MPRAHDAIVAVSLAFAMAIGCRPPADVRACSGSVSGGVAAAFACTVSVTYDVASDVTTVAVTRSAPDGSGPSTSAPYLPTLAIAGPPAARSYSTGADDVLWAVSAVNTPATGYYASKAFPNLADCGSISVAMTAVEVAAEDSVSASYSVRGSFEASLCSVEDGTTATAAITGSF